MFQLFGIICSTHNKSYYTNLTINLKDTEIHKIQFKEYLTKNEYSEAIAHLNKYFDGCYDNVRDRYNRNFNFSSCDSVTNKYKLTTFVNATELCLHDGSIFLAAQMPFIDFKDRFIEMLEKTETKIIITLADIKNFPFDDYFTKDQTKKIYYKLFSRNMEVEEYKTENIQGQRFSYANWKDQQAPDLTTISDLYKIVQENTKLGSKILVHCIVGVGRTGVFIMFYILKQFDKVDVDLFIDVLFYLRSKRNYMVYSPEQLKFLYEHFVINKL